MPEKKLLIIGHTWPEPTTTAAGQRTMQLVKCLGEAGFEIIVASTAAFAEFSFKPELYGVAVKSIRLNDSGFDRWVEGLAPQVVFFDRFITEEQFGWRVAEAIPGALRILDTQDLHSLRICREEALAAREEFSTSRWLQHECTLRELASIYRSDCSLIISEFEYQLLLDLPKISPALLHYLPFMLPRVDEANIRSFKDREGFVYLGNGRHRPNIDAIHWLKSEIWPGIRNQLPEARLQVYGAYLPPDVLKLHRPEDGFYIMGWVEDSLAAIGRAKVQLAPLRFGAGIKGKLTESMQSGTPSVTTGIGAEGMHNNLPWNGVITGDAKDFADAAVRLYSDENVWYEARRHGIAIINQIYQGEKLGKALLEKIARMQQDLEAHRTGNVIGAMLRHQSMAGTKYMGKWIEAKQNSAS